MKVSNFSLKRQTYEAPTVEVLEIETQSVLCGSGGGAAASSSFTGTGGIHFGTTGGSW